ncbi:MAG: biotin attachment protein [Candidatus Wallbacteria bacterium HGW-Wallbacteria-1]|uniref:Biotin attachment protein n=1 Tax=Candidatus Wallbacteria bacterium HGW-Wallbacteria-1 TaxID=2013854 RepID=A0A2N1PIV1_9BACT|nr:MAG: biotin attachment protein [Candidatus Wallbacteria bacterium HGW-Wallbacteria-1]
MNRKKLKKINFMVTAFRDGFQSVYGARVFTSHFMPAVQAAREAGILHFEAGGGARFQSLYFYSNEDAFEMMDEFRRVAGPDANLQTLARGVNVVGLDSQPRDIIDLHARLFRKHGITTVRNFDALNDVNNLIYSGKCISAAGLKHEVTITMMALPPGAAGAHDAPFYQSVLRAILDAEIPFDSVCFKDASGTSTPRVVHETIKAARDLLGSEMNLVFHSHETAGISIAQYLSAIEAGASQVDLSMAPVSGGTCQPDIMTLWHALRGSEFDLDIDIDKVMEAEEIFKECMADYFLPPEATMVNPLIPFSPLPGGALTANTQMLRDNGLMDRFHEITMAMGEVVMRGGYGTSVTPVSQFYFQQAFNNVLHGPWKKIVDGYGKMVLGYFGRTPLPPDPEIVRIASEQLGLEPTDRLVVDINDADPSKGIAAARAMLEAEGLPVTDENIFIAAACREKGILYLQGRATANVRMKSDEKPAAVTGSATSETAAASDTAAKSDTLIADGQTVQGQNVHGKSIVTINNREYQVHLQGHRATVNGITYDVAVRADHDTDSALSSENGTGRSGAPGNSDAQGTSAGRGSSVETGKTFVKAPMPGLILRIQVRRGQRVKEGDPLLIMEAMKMETVISAPCSGAILDIAVAQGDQKRSGDVLVVLS